MRWAQITINSTEEAVDAVGQCLSRAGCAGFAEADAGGSHQVSGYLPVDDRLEERLLRLKEDVGELPSYGIDGAGSDLTLTFVEEEDWANAWKQYFKPIRVGDRLVVTPPWESPTLAGDDIPLVIDPGMAFGTGSHGTTQLCLEALERLVKPGMTVADIGTGSGILAIAARKLGASRVNACDIDPLAVKIARENAAVNGVAIDVTEEMVSEPADVVVANILADVIIGLQDELFALVRPGGHLIASGIIDSRAGDVRQSLEATGFKALETTTKTEWVALVLERPA